MLRPADVPVRRATASDHDAVVRVLARSFDRDPAVTYLLRKDAGRARAFERCFSAFFSYMCLPHGEVWMEEQGHGAALWTPPGRWDVGLRRVWMVPDLVRAVGLSRMPSMMRATARAQRVHPRAPHYYLFALGVDPEHQGRGIGSAMLTSVLRRCDADRAPAYLEASTEQSARLYARHGFAGDEPLSIADDAPPIWPMWRAPSSR